MDELAEGLADVAEALLAAGDPDAALGAIADELAMHGPSTSLLTLAANAWVTLVDLGTPLDEWDPIRRQALLRRLIIQDSCDASPPILHHRIAAQHSGGIPGHLLREARALGPTLDKLLWEESPHPRTVMLALLLRDAMDGIDQDRLSALHRRMFASFHVDDLQIPYNIVFDQKHFGRNIEDMERYVRERGAALVDGALPLPHLLLLYWLVPRSFASLPSDWPETAIRARLAVSSSADEAAAARSLRLRFGITPPFTGEIEFTRCANDLADVRRVLFTETGADNQAAVSRLEQRPRQLATGILNEVRSRLPIIRSRRRLRVAICVSGQLRGFRRAWATWRPLLADIDATVFVNSWKKIGRGTPEPFRSILPFEGPEFCAAYKRIGAETGLDELRTRYPHLFTALDQSSGVEESDLAALYGTAHVHLDDETDAAFSTFTNSEKMYYKVQRCFEMTQIAGEEFDLIVRLRPDKPIRLVAFEWPNILAALQSRPALYCETALGVYYGALLMGDQVAIGLPGAMRVYAETFSRSSPIAALAPYRMEPHLWGHTSVAQLCWFAGMEVRKVPIKFGQFLEAEPLAAISIDGALARDSVDRMDAIDRQLIAANRRDLRR